MWQACGFSQSRSKTSELFLVSIIQRVGLKYQGNVAFRTMGEGKYFCGWEENSYMVDKKTKCLDKKNAPDWFQSLHHRSGLSRLPGRYGLCSQLYQTLCSTSSWMYGWGMKEWTLACRCEFADNHYTYGKWNIEIINAKHTDNLIHMWGE